MLLHNNKGVLSPTSSEVNDVSITYRLGTDDSNSDFVESASSVEDLRPLTTYWELTNDENSAIYYIQDATISAVGLEGFHVQSIKRGS